MNILVTGGTGLLGKGFEETKTTDDLIVSLHVREYAVDSRNAHHEMLDVTAFESLRRLFIRYGFDVVLHSAGIANVDFVENNREAGRFANVQGTLNVIRLCKEFSSKLIYISTNAVFDGKQAPYRETDPVCPVNIYGSLKSECEKLVREQASSFCIVRPILMYGWNHPFGRRNPVTWTMEKLGKGEKIRMVDDVYENPLFNVQCGEVLWKIIDRNTTGTIHLAGKDTLNRYQLAVLVAREFDLDASLIEPVPSSFFPSIAKRPPNTSFRTERMISELGVEPLSVKEGLKSMRLSDRNDSLPDTRGQ